MRIVSRPAKILVSWSLVALSVWIWMERGSDGGMTFSVVGGLHYASLVAADEPHELFQSLSDDQKRQARLSCGSGCVFGFLLISALTALTSTFVSRASDVRIIEPIGVCYAIQIGVAGLFGTALTFLRRNL